MASASIDKLKPKARIPEAVSSFIKKTFDLLEEQKFPEIVDWNIEGTAIIIKNPTEFGQKVLPTYFKHSNLTSFVRQLNMYDFHKRRTQRYDHVYYHDLFQRNKRHLLQEIKRKNQDNTLANIQKAIETLETVQGGQKVEINTSTYENQLLKKLNKDALSRISSLENKVKDLTIQNQALWNQITQQKQKEDLLVTLLAGFMKNKGITLDQLPNILSNQFNLPITDINSETRLLESSTMCESTEDCLHKSVLQDNVRDFLTFSDSPSSSIEISPGDNKCFGPNESNEALNEVKPESFSHVNGTKSMNQEYIAPLNNYPGDWSQMMPYQSTGIPGVLGKRAFDIQKGEFWNTQKFIKHDQFSINQHGNPFFGSDGKKELCDMRIQKNDSLTDTYLNIDNNNIDLLNFS